MEKNMKIVWAVIAVIVIAVLGIWWYLSSQNTFINQANNNQTGNNQSETSNATNSNTNTTNTTPKATTYLVAKPNLSLNEVQNLYGSNRIQFDEKCISLPIKPTFKVGTTIMLQNISSKAKEITLDSTSYTINAYNYILVKLVGGTSLPYTILIDCGKGENNTSLLLQK